MVEELDGGGTAVARYTQGLGISSVMLNVAMPRQKHYYGENHLHFLTTSIYPRTQIFP